MMGTVKGIVSVTANKVNGRTSTVSNEEKEIEVIEVEDLRKRLKEICNCWK